MADKVVLEAEVKSNIGEVSKDAAGLASEFKFMGVSVNGVKTSLKAMATTAKASFGTMKAAMISTGIGALVVALGAVVSHLTNTKEGSEKLKRVMSGLGAVVDRITDMFSDLGGNIINVFTNPKEAIKELWESIKSNLMSRMEGVVKAFKAVGRILKGVFTMNWDEVAAGARDYGDAILQVSTAYDVDEQREFMHQIGLINDRMKEAYETQKLLTHSRQKLTDAEREFSKERAKTRGQIQKARLEALDETKTAEERLAALERANQKELATTRKAIKLGKEKARIKREENKINKSLEEDLEELASLEVAVIDLQTQSYMTQKRMATEMESLRNEIAAKKKADEKEAADALKEEQAAEEEKLKHFAKIQTENTLNVIEDLLEREKEKLRIEREAQLESIGYLEATLEQKAILDEQYRIKEKALDVKQSDARKALSDAETQVAKDNLNEQLSAFSNLAGALSSLAGDNKELAVASAIIDTYVGANKAFAQGGMVGYIGAAAVIASGLANVQKILSTDVGVGGGGGAAPAAAQTPAPQMMSGSFDLSGGQSPEALRAYVVTDEMTNSQNQLANIRRRATI